MSDHSSLHDEDRFARLMALAPRRFNISASPAFPPPYDVSFVLWGGLPNDIGDDGSHFFYQHNGIRNCRPGIWTSRKLPVSKAFQTETYKPENGEFEVILYWVDDGEIDMGLQADKWEEYERATREVDAQVNLKDVIPEDAEWKRAGTYFDDGGICAIISANYLSRDAARNIMDENVDEVELLHYYETLISNGSFWGYPGNNFTLGGLCCKSVLFQKVPPYN
jgi:hypothetical protein